MYLCPRPLHRALVPWTLENPVPRRQRSPLVVGSGIAGLYVALRCAEEGLRPILVTKSRLEESNTRYAQGGIAAAIGPGDSVALHLRDTVRAGDGLVDLHAARCLTGDAPARIADLARYGVPFDTVEGRISLGREGAHSRARIVHAGGDATGLRIEETLRERVVEAGVEARERRVLRRLTHQPRRGVVAEISSPSGGSIEEVSDRPIVLATGGAGSLFRESSTPAIATGEGVAIALRAGAMVRDMEFIQFHPTAFYRRGAPRFLISEALRGEGARLVNGAGRRFLPRYHPLAELAPRDVVSRAIASELRKSGAECVYLDATRLAADALYTRFPTICRFLLGHGVDPAHDPIPVAPVAHYMIGGVATDLAGRTTLPGLLACGEAASTGVHGANRLASNSLLEGVVFGERVVRQLLRPSRGGPAGDGPRLDLPRVTGDGHGLDRRISRAVRGLLWQQVGIVRD
ncbi:MAG: L-aspartate oxidase, partial [Thermoplasmata archaeon]|nr:L-aspartate oxidase [Thermoplasmata archaeon]